MAKKKANKGKPNSSVNPLDWAQKSLSARAFSQLTESLSTPLSTAIRINQLKSDPASCIERWGEAYGWETRAVPFCPSGFWVSGGESAPSKTIEHRLGYYYIQEAASMLPAELFDFSEAAHPVILDMAASPGGKTIQLVDQTSDKGLVIANDGSRSRIQALRIVLQNWGAINQAITCLPGERFGTIHPETFDAVLLDAPCSMQGLRTSASHKQRPITESEISSLAERQFRLLESALVSAKVGGQVVYSTCTLSPFEDEQVVSHILKKFPDAVEIVDIHHTLPSPAYALTDFSDIQFHPHTKMAARIWPHLFGTAGFFCAKFIKKGSILPSIKMNETTSRTSNVGEIMDEQKGKQLTEEISNRYGFDLQGVIEEQALAYREQDGNVYLAPAEHLRQFEDLPLLSSGMLIGKALPKGWLPSHEFTCRFGDQFTDHIYTLDETFQAAWLRGEDIRKISGKDDQIGTIFLIRDGNGRNLGRGKMLRDRLKNMLPPRLF